MHRIIDNEMILSNVGRMVVEAPYIAEKRKAGQFIILRINECGERIPLTIGDADATKGLITLFYQVVGKSTKHLSMLKAGETLEDIAGPLGHPTEIERYGTVACVGGGIGVAPLYPIVKAMREKGNRVLVVIGARNKELLILEKELREASDEISVCTDDGSHGKKAFVTEALAEICGRERADLVVAIGPVPMMRAVSRQTEKDCIKTIVSLNSIMIDGTGMCGGCRVTVGGERRFTCVDGPEFDGHMVDFDELMLRLNTYKAFEAQSLERFDHECRLQGAIYER